jgi:23S rRNA (guanosine2251-2'-O)-methyltransferase
LKKKFIFGIHPVEEALAKGQTLDKIWIDSGARNPKISSLIPAIKEAGIPFVKAPAEKLTFLVSNPNHQGIVAAISPIAFQGWEEIVTRCFEAGKDPLLLVLDGITDVRNFGAILRSAACAGADAVIIPAKGSAAVGQDVVTTSSGAVFRIPVCRVEQLVQTVRQLREHGLRIVAATEKGKESLFQSRLDGPLAVIMGNEEKGVEPALLQLSDIRASIPMPGGFDSLNVSVATGIFLFEVLRQRGLEG